MSQLSDYDKAILNCVFNPNLPLDEAIIKPPEELKDEEEITAEIKQATDLEIEAVQEAERGNLNEALDMVNKAIAITPKKPSLYNNRAHIYQYLRKFEGLFSFKNGKFYLCYISYDNLVHTICQNNDNDRKEDLWTLNKWFNSVIFIFHYNVLEALEDTTTAISLATDRHKKTLCQAHCQRGLLYRRSDKLDLARADFEVAANFGNQFAKAQLVELNPYAALCNQMLRQVMDTLK